MRRLLKRNVGVFFAGKGASVCLWAPKESRVSVVWHNGRSDELTRDDEGYHKGFFEEAPSDALYEFHLHDSDKIIPDPASRHQPHGVFGPSQIVSEVYDWTDQDWRGIPFSEWVIYEVHTGTFSGTQDFDGIIADLPRLKKLGINVIELMPVAQFSGRHNWGYDGVFPFAPQNNYGGPQGLKKLVNECHRHGMAIILDVVYNHFGPEGNVFSLCGPYSKEDSSLPWGHPLNFDDKYSDHVRHYFLQNMLQWLIEFHFDGLRLDAVHAIHDDSAIPFLEEALLLAKEAEGVVGFPLVILAESNLNDPRLLEPGDAPGFHAQWNDDFHHALHATLTGERNGYYADYGDISQLAHIYKRGVLFEGQYCKSRKRRHGRPFNHIARNRLIVFSQNHDQIGNRNDSARLATLVGLEKAKLAAAAMLLSPFTPMLFMGEEWGSTRPFNYFLDFESETLIEDSKKGRRKEWASFGWKTPPPDPGAIETYRRSWISDKAEAYQAGAETAAYYMQLIALSKRIRRQTAMDVVHDEARDLIWLYYTLPEARIAVCLSFSEEEQPVEPRSGPWRLLMGTEDHVGPYAAAVFEGDLL